MKKKIGLIGGSGCGKSTVARMLCKYGLMHIDCDQIARQVVEPGTPCLAELVAHFGDQILHEDGSLNRAQLALLAFSQPEQTQALNQITHKYILEETDRIFDQSDAPLGAIVDAAALAESGYLSKCDHVIAVISSKCNRIKRIMRRDNITIRAALRRLHAQKPNHFYCNHADFVIVNNGSLSKLEQQTLHILKQIFSNDITQEE